MAVLEFRKDKVVAICSHSTLNEDGEPEQLSEGRCVEVGCDAVANGQADVIMTDGGKQLRYSYTLYLDANCPNFYVGQLVRLERANGEVQEAQVLGFHRYQLQAIMWI